MRREFENESFGRWFKAHGWPKTIAATSFMLVFLFGGLTALTRNDEMSRVDRTKREAIVSPPLCPSLQGEDWRVISRGRNTLLVADVVEPGLFPRFEERREAELAGLSEVLQRFEGKVLSVVPDQGGFRHIVTVTDDKC